MPGRGIADVVRAAIKAEEASNWALVRQIPSTYTWKALDYIVALTPIERAQLFAAVERNALFMFEPAPDSSEYAGRWPAFDKFTFAIAQMADWKYMDVRTLRAILGNVRGKRPDPAFAQIPAAVIERAAAINAISAAEIRKTVRSAVDAHFGAKPQNRGGLWTYAGSWDGLPSELSIDYGARYAQLRYEIRFADPVTGIVAESLVYERMVGAGLRDWDFITADNVHDSAELLCTLVKKLLGLPRMLLEADA